jgi:hypothetical protein
MVEGIVFTVKVSGSRLQVCSVGYEVKYVVV